MAKIAKRLLRQQVNPYCRSDDINKYISPIPFEVLAWDKHVRDIPLNKEMIKSITKLGQPQQMMQKS